MKFKIFLMLAAFAVASFQSICAMEHKNPYGRNTGNKFSQYNPRRNPRARGLRGPSTQEHARRQEERNLKRAIQLSLDDHGRNAADPQLQRALELSRQEAERLHEKEQEDLDRTIALSFQEDDRRREEVNQKFRSLVFREGWTDSEIQEIVDLIKAGADVKARDEKVSTPLFWAANNGNAEVCLALIEVGADVNAKDKFGFTPLRTATKKGFPEVCRALISNGADVNADKDRYGSTLLHCAARSGFAEVCRVFITQAQFLPEEEDIMALYERIKTALLVFNRHPRRIPKDVCYLMLCGNADLRNDVRKLFVHRLRNGKMIPPFGRALVIEWLYGYTLECLKPLMNEALKGARDDKVKSILNSEALELNFGEEIQRVIEERVSRLMESQKRILKIKKVRMVLNNRFLSGAVVKPNMTC